MKKLPKELTLHDTEGIPVEYRPLTTVKDKHGKPVELFMPIVNRSFFKLVSGGELFKHIFCRPEGKREFVEVTPLELKHALNITPEDVTLKLSFYTLETALRDNGLEANKETIEQEAKNLAGKPYLRPGRHPFVIAGRAGGAYRAFKHLGQFL